MNKKAFIMHPVTWIIISLIVGFVIALLMARGIIPSPFAICPGG